MLEGNWCRWNSMSHGSRLFRRWSSEMRKTGLFRPGERIGVAVSGGADSVLLLFFMEQLSHDMGLHVVVVHFNHQLRGPESTADEQFVRQQAESLGMEFIRGEAAVARVARERHANLEATARELRYRFFFSLVNQGRVNKVVTAHTANDQAETVLLRLLRGSGAKGLGGIYPVLEGKVARPFLNLTRAEIDSELSRRKLDVRVDASNRDTRFLRNKVRAELLPLLEREYNPAIVSLLSELADRARDDEAYLERQAWERAHAWRIREGRNEKIPVSAFARFPASTGRRVLRQMIAAASGHLRGVTHGHVEALRRLAVEGQSGRTLVLPHGLAARKEFDWLIIGVTERGIARNGYSYPVEVPGKTRIPELGSTFLFEIVNSPGTGKGYNGADGPKVDLSKLKGDLRIRNWQPGDSFRPVGSRKVRKVKELFQERRIPLTDRRLWPVLDCGKSVIWVRGFPPDAQVAASPATEKVVTIVEQPLEHRE
jgi:tRNA(Ile)-lysidine synthase